MPKKATKKAQTVISPMAKQGQLVKGVNQKVAQIVGNSVKELVKFLDAGWRAFIVRVCQFSCPFV